MIDDFRTYKYMAKGQYSAIESVQGFSGHPGNSPSFSRSRHRRLHPGKSKTGSVEVQTNPRSAGSGGYGIEKSELVRRPLENDEAYFVLYSIGPGSVPPEWLRRRR